MTFRQSYGVTLALRLVAKGMSVSEAARKHGVAITSVRRALRRAGIPPLPPRPRGKVLAVQGTSDKSAQGTGENSGNFQKAEVTGKKSD